MAQTAGLKTNREIKWEDREIKEETERDIGGGFERPRGRNVTSCQVRDS
jgi:hypothetical protein